MMSIEQRLSKAERLMGGHSSCSCPNPLRVYYSRAILPGQSDMRPPELCEVCGGRFQILQIAYVDGWRACERAN